MLASISQGGSALLPAALKPERKRLGKQTHSSASLSWSIAASTRNKRRQTKHQPSATAQGNPGGMQLQTIQNCKKFFLYRGLLLLQRFQNNGDFNLT